MSKVISAAIAKELSEKFSVTDKEVLGHLNENGGVISTVVDGKKIYGAPAAVRSQYSPPVVVDYFCGPSLTQQQFKDETDIKEILKKYGVGDNFVPGAVSIPLEYFRDVSTAPRDYLEALAVIDAANDAFMELPAELRRAVGDKPERLLELSQSEAGVKELIKLGFGKHDPKLLEIEQELSKKDPVTASAPSETEPKAKK